MTYYKLVASGRSDMNVDEIILTRDDFGEVQDSVSVHRAHELPADEVDSVTALTNRIGYAVVEAPEPEQGLDAGTQLAELQEVGTVVITQTAPSAAPQSVPPPPTTPES